MNTNNDTTRSQPGRWSISASLVFVAALAIGCQFALPFAIATLVVSFFVFSKIEADQNVYDVGFYFTRFPSARLLGWFRAFGKIESVVRSLLLGLLAWFTFAGNDQSRVNDATLRLCGAVLASYFLLSLLVRKARLNVLRWAYLKLSVVLGVVFSVLSVFTRTPRRSWMTTVWDGIKERLPWRPKPTIDKNIDHIHTILNDAVEWIHAALDKAVGEPAASILMVLFNSEILMGFMVVLYTYLLLLLTTPELRRRPEDRNGKGEADPNLAACAESPPDKA